MPGLHRSRLPGLQEVKGLEDTAYRSKRHPPIPYLLPETRRHAPYKRTSRTVTSALPVPRLLFPQSKAFD